jgi:hypothetical protein
MAKKKEPKAEPSPAADRDRLVHVAASILKVDGEIRVLQEDRTEYFRDLKDSQIHPEALKLCLRLLKKSPADRILFLECFDDMCATLGMYDHATVLDNQLDIEDAVSKARAKDAAAAEAMAGKPDGPLN